MVSFGYLNKKMLKNAKNHFAPVQVFNSKGKQKKVNKKMREKEILNNFSFFFTENLTPLIMTPFLNAYLLLYSNR